jgi:hypothetical protein
MGDRLYELLRIQDTIPPRGRLANAIYADAEHFGYDGAWAKADLTRWLNGEIQAAAPPAPAAPPPPLAQFTFRSGKDYIQAPPPPKIARYDQSLEYQRIQRQRADRLQRIAELEKQQAEIKRKIEGLKARNDTWQDMFDNVLPPQPEPPELEAFRELARRQRNTPVENAFKSLAEWSRAQDDRYQRDEVKRIQKEYNEARNGNYDRYNFNVADLNEEGMKPFNQWFQHILQRDIANLPADEWEFRYKFRGVDRWGRRQLNAGTLGEMFQQLQGAGLGEEQNITSEHLTTT